MKEHDSRTKAYAAIMLLIICLLVLSVVVGLVMLIIEAFPPIVLLAIGLWLMVVGVILDLAR